MYTVFMLKKLKLAFPSQAIVALGELEMVDFEVIDSFVIVVILISKLRLCCPGRKKRVVLDSR